MDIYEFRLDKDGKLNLYEIWKSPKPFYLVCTGQHLSRPDYDIDEKTFHSIYKKAPFCDYDWFYTHVFDSDDEIGDNIHHNLFSDYYGCKYTNVYNFRTPFMSIDIGDEIKFSENELKAILRDYHHLIEVNNPPFSLSDKDVLLLLSSLVQYKTIPALGYSGELNPPTYCFWTVEDVTKLPLLLLIAIYKNIFGFKTWEYASSYFLDYAIMWKEDGTHYFSAYLPTWADAASKFSGFPVKSFDEENIGCNTPFDTDRYELPSSNYSKINLLDLKSIIDAFDEEDTEDEISVEELEKNLGPAPEPYAEQEIEQWNPTPNPYSPQIEELEKQKKSIIASRKKIVKYILPIAIPGGISLVLLYIGILISILSHSFVGGLVIPGIILLVIALIFLPFLIKTGKHNKSCNQRFRSINLQIIDLKKKSDEFDKQQKQEKAEYDARVAKQKEENTKQKEDYEFRLAQYNAEVERIKRAKSLKETQPTEETNTNTQDQLVFELLPDGEGYMVSALNTYDEPFTLEKVVIPPSHQGLPVKEIKENGFNHLKTLKEVVLPDTITVINDDGFHRSENIESINLPESLTKIGNSAFYFCLHLKNLVLPSKLKHLGSYCFQRCELIGDIKIPKSVEYIGDEIFLNCLSTKQIYLDDVPVALRNNSFSSKFLNRIYINISFEEFLDKSMSFPKESLSKVYVLKNNNYQRINSEEITFTEEKLFINIPIIMHRFFFRNNYIKEVVFGPKVREIGRDAFGECKNLAKCEFSSGLEKIDDYAFGKTAIENIVLPETVFEIGDRAFSSMNSLKHISFPKKVKYFKNWLAFSNTNAHIDWPQSVESEYISSFSSFGFDFETLSIPEGITGVPSNFIVDNTFIKRIIFPKSLLSISQRAFVNLESLETITLLNPNTNFAPDSFYKCNKLEIEEHEQQSLASVKCKNGMVKVKKLYDFGDKDAISETLFAELFGELFEPYSLFDFNNFEDLIDYFLRKKNTFLCGNVRIGESFDPKGNNPINIDGGEYYYYFDAIDKKTSIENFLDDSCVGLFYSNSTIDLAIVKVDKITKDNLWSDYESQNEDIWISNYIKDQNGTIYLLVFAGYDR